MSTTLSVTAHASKNSPEFQKHFKAVGFCIENDLSFPAETSAFFKGKIGGGDLESVIPAALMKHLENGIVVDMPVENNGYQAIIKVSDIPAGVDLIMVKLN
jgi:16S rRNA C967 or C1407 C5-methylase (RsmB/RsmF family)